MSPDVTVSPLGYGAAPLGNVYGEVDPAIGIASVHRAIDLGVTFFDVSPYYGNTVAEDVLGRALAGRREEVILCTKAGRYGADTFDFSAERIGRSAEESLRRLRTDYLDVLLAHDIEFGDPEQVLGETIDALEDVKRRGLCRMIGASAYPLHVLRRAIEARRLDAVISYCHYCLFNTGLEDLIPVARSRGTRVINASPLGMGLLADAPPPDWHPAPPDLVTACRRAAEICAAHGVQLADLALQFAMGAQGVWTTVIGMPTTDQVERNVRAAEIEPDRELLAAVREVLAPVDGTTWPSGSAAWDSARA